MPERSKILVCSCEGTMPLDNGALRRGCQGFDIVTGRQLCRAELERVHTLARSGVPLTIGCTQEEPVFHEIGAATGAEMRFVNLRESAGWSADAAHAGPKMAALAAAATVPMPEISFVRIDSGGVALVYGRDEQAIEAASLLKDQLDVTVLLARPGAITPPRRTDFPVAKGMIRLAKGHIGAFELVVDDYALPIPAIRSLCSRRCCAPATSPAASTSRAMSTLRPTSVRILARGSSAAASASICVRRARSHRPATMWRSMTRFALAAANAPRPARPARRVTRCRRRMRCCASCARCSPSIVRRAAHCRCCCCMTRSMAGR